MNESIFHIARTDGADDLPLPEYMTSGAVGMDLRANVTEDITLKPGERRAVPAGVKIALPPLFEAQVRPRSGLALKNGVTTLNAPGTIDSDYRGEITVILINHGSEDFTVKRGDRIAQLVINKIERIEWTESETLPGGTKRGDGGFGHTGV